MNQLGLFYADRERTVELIKRQARHLCYKYGYVNSDMIRETMDLPDWIDKRIIGACLQSRDFKCVGYTKTKVKTSHGRPIGRFVLNTKKKESA